MVVYSTSLNHLPTQSGGRCPSQSLQLQRPLQGAIHPYTTIHHTPPHAIPAATFHSNTFMQLPQQRPLQQLPHPLQNAVSALMTWGLCGAFVGTSIVESVLTTRSNARLQAKGVKCSLENKGARYAARSVHMINLCLPLRCRRG
jgi:hypothetical protein